MSPNNNELPPPVAEQPPIGAAEVAPGNPEQAAMPEQGNRAAAPPSAPSALPATIPLPTPPAMPAAPQSLSPTTTQNNPAQASDDADLIEKEWVVKAKQIVDRTRNDPYKQSEELTMFKADYMKKRYNKTVKVSK